MCTSGDDEEGGSAAGTTSGYSGAEVPEIVVTAPRLALNQETIDQIDWSDVGVVAAIGAVTGLYSGGIGTALVNAAAAAAGTIETEDDIDLVDLFQIQNDIIVVPGVPGPYIPLY